jgi:hypothetical protein
MEEGRGTRKNRSWISPLAKLARIFVHGIAFSVLLSIFYIAWVFIAAFLIVAGFELAFLLGLIIGLVLAFAIFILVAGALNTLITEVVWGVDLKHDWQSILAHAFVLFVALVLAGIPSLVIRYIVPGWLTTIGLTICYCFIDGFVCRSVGAVWMVERTEYDSPWFSILKYPLLIGLIMADITIAIPAFVVSLATTLWWAGIIVFCVLHSPLAFLVLKETRNANSAIQPKDGWWTPNQPQEPDKPAFSGFQAPSGFLTIKETRNPNPPIQPKDEWWTPNQPREPGKIVLAKLSSTELFVKFFLHGLAFSALLMISVIYAWIFYIWIFFATFPALSGLINILAIGSLIVGIGCFLLVIGGLNVILTQAIWHVSTRQDVKNILGHGFLLFALLVMAGIPMVFVIFAAPTLILHAYVFDILITIFFISYCFLNGLIASRIALYWKKRE